MMDQKNLSVLLILQLSLVSINSITFSMVNNLPSYLTTNLYHDMLEKKQIPVLASSRIQRWALTLSAYQYYIRYKAGKHLSNADALSRLPRSQSTSEYREPGDLVHLINHLSTKTTTASSIKAWTH